MKKFKIIRNIRENGQKLDQSIQMRQNSQMSSDCTASYICSVQSSLCIDNHSFVSNHAGVVSDHAGFVSDHAGVVSDHAGFVSDHTGVVSDHAGVQSDHAGVASDQAGFVSDQAGVSHRRSLERDDSDNRHSRDDKGNIWSTSSGKNDNHNSTQSKISQRSLTYHNSLSNKNIVETQF